MKKNYRLFLLLNLFFILTAFTYAQQTYYVSLKNDGSHLINVTLEPGRLSAGNNIYQFAATAPGTYQEMDIGRFVKQFKAFDASGNEISTTHSSLNQWTISEPTRVNKIEYTVSSTWETPVDSNIIFPMCGSSIKEDNALLNGQCFVGYVSGKQDSPVKIKLDYPKDWNIGTALEKDAGGFYTAENYDRVVDSPILLGRLTRSEVNVGGTKVDVFTYSKSGLITSDSLLGVLKEILQAEDKFMEGLPVQKYVFLFHFDKLSYGAWEHSYSSDYTMEDKPLNPNYLSQLRGIVAHEFYHIFTPLTLHSELVEHFNFEKPVMSQHLWLYEGVTEWAANIMELRSNLITPEEYLKRMSEKMEQSSDTQTKFSLRDLALNSYKMQKEYPDIYQRGAMVAGLLDLKLLELSHGERGLREVLHELSQQYGAKKAFSENTFFDDFTRATYPEIGDFFKKYVIGTEPLPVKEYFSKVGIDYKEFAGYDSSRARTGLAMTLVNNKICVDKVDPALADKDIKYGDVVFKVMGDTLTMDNVMTKVASMRKMKVGDELQMTLLRENVPHDVTIKLVPSRIEYVFNIQPDPTPEQLKLRTSWMSMK